MIISRRSNALIFLLLLWGIQGCGLIVRSTQQVGTEIVNSELFRRGRHGKLNDQELEWAKTAWKYFTNNYHAETGLVNGSDNFSAASVWNIADTIAATVAAHHLGLINDYEFDHRITPLLEFLNSMELSSGQLPNIFYAADSGRMADGSGNAFGSWSYKGKTGDGDGHDDGSDGHDRKEGQKNKQVTSKTDQPDNPQTGWSAVDIGRLLIWLQNLRSYAPQYAEYIDKAVLRWKFCQVIDDCGKLHGINRNSSTNPPSQHPEEPLGYNDYALMGYAAWGFPQPDNTPDLPLMRLYGVEMPHSREDSRETGSPDPLVSTPYLLQGIEFNWDTINDHGGLDSFSSNSAAAELAQRIYIVQERRYQHERIFTARAEHRRKSKPYILYDAILADGYAWNTVTPEGKTYPDLSIVSTSAAFGMWALWKTSYTDSLIRLIGTLYDPERGWFEGRREKNGAYEQTISCTTNAMVLEALHYKAQGKLYKAPKPSSYADIVLKDEFRRPPCSPPERKGCPRK